MKKQNKKKKLLDKKETKLEIITDEEYVKPVFLVEPETLLVKPDTDNIEDWKKFHTQTTELLDLKTIILTELIGFINAKLYYLEEADQLNDASLNVAEMLDLQKAKKEKNTKKNKKKKKNK